MTQQAWNPHTTVIVCGVSDGVVTPNGLGSQQFQDLKAALAVFPDLDPAKGTKRFTAALGNSQTDVMRFETWAANNVYST